MNETIPAPQPRDLSAATAPKRRNWPSVAGITAVGATTLALAFGAPAASAAPAAPAPTFTVTHAPFLQQLSPGQQNAVQSAQQYLEISAFSRSGLIDQLEYEGYSTDDATSAVDSLNVDWNEQAAKSAKEYLELTSFSRSGLIDQLVYEGFTYAQAEYGVNAVY
ncbi:Ltp family lipoprotein [Nocardia higoensis]|uniref:Ltp family lipoprotein n=1 Tax=Nocardia higoensis TaxID=228599 RepID=UPI0002DAA680|nr:Ltp family lipoprotein [Nocardia higoensis]